MQFKVSQSYELNEQMAKIIDVSKLNPMHLYLSSIFVIMILNP